MKFENKDPEHLSDAEYAVGVAYDWINERGYQVPARQIEVWSHPDAVHDWVLVFGDWHGDWEEIECMPYVPTWCVEAWACIEKGTFRGQLKSAYRRHCLWERLGAENLGEINLFMLKMEKEWLEYEQESRVL